MIKINRHHITALSHAEQYIYPAIKRNLAPRVKLEVEKDLTRIDEVKQFLMRVIGEPGLPFNPDQDQESQSDGH